LTACSTAIVVTTIHAPAFLQSYVANLRTHGRTEEVAVFIIPDRKTPHSVSCAAQKARLDGFDVRCPGIQEQEQFLGKLALPEEFIPWNSDNRRNVGFLMALDAGCEVLISIDDDNFCLPDVDFIGEHGAVGKEALCAEVSSSDGWFNVCSLLQADLPVEVFPRGFPYSARRSERVTQTSSPADPAVVAANAGLWLRDPDLDAVSRLALDTKTRSWTGESRVLAPDTWSPVNTQNTALTREAATAYYYIRMGYPAGGLRIDRFGDILSGYFLQKCAKRLGHAVRVGSPVVEHRRTPHDLLQDLTHEMPGILLLEDLLPWLKEASLEGATFIETYCSLAEHLAAARSSFRGFIWEAGGRDFLLATSEAMRTWAAAVGRILS